MEGDTPGAEEADHQEEDIRVVREVLVGLAEVVVVEEATIQMKEL